MRTLTPTSAIGLEIGAEAFWNCFNSDFISMDCVIDPISAKLTASGGWTAWPSSPKDPSAMDIREDCRFHPRQDDAIQALEQLRLALKIAFATVMQKGGITPLAALNLAASAIGSLYVEVAAAHSGSDRCSCGWEPRGDADIEALISSLGLSAADGPPSLRPTMQVGRARERGLVRCSRDSAHAAGRLCKTADLAARPDQKRNLSPPVKGASGESRPAVKENPV